MLRVGTGDHAAFGLLVDRRLDRAVALAQRILGDRAAAEDVAQEAFLRVWRHAGRWKPPEEKGGAKFSTWFYRVTVNLCLDRKRRPVAASLEAVTEPRDPGPDAFDQVSWARTAAWVERAIAALPERQRAALVLCAYEAMSMAQAAEVMSVSVKAVESLLVRARRNLRETLRPCLEDAWSGSGGGHAAPGRRD